MVTSRRYDHFKLILILMCVCWPRLSSASDDERPNIVFFVADDLGWNDIGYHNFNFSRPHIDHLVKNAVVLENYYVQPSCSPTRSQFLTGRYQIHTHLQHGIFFSTAPTGIPLSEVTIADKLKEVGYATHLVGKWHAGYYEKEYMPQYRGFDSFYGYLTAEIDYFNKTYPYRGIEYLDFRDESGPLWGLHGIYTVDLYNERVESIIKSHDQSKGPIFLYFAQQVVHRPVEVPERYLHPVWNIGDETRRIYGGMFSALDESAGKLVDALKTNGMWDNTLLVFTTDNGAQTNDGGNNWPLRGVKRTYWEGGIRGVAFVSGGYLHKNLAQGLRHGYVNKELMHITDWHATLLSLAGSDFQVNGTKELDGFDQWDMITKGTKSKRTEILHNIDRLNESGRRLYDWTFDTRIQAALRVGDFKILTGDPGDGTWYAPPECNDLHDIVPPDPGFKNVWLFNIAEDPQEKNDLSDTRPDLVVDLLNKLREYQATAVPPINPRSFCPLSNPALHGNVWGPWYET